jgi:hypothetical protein
MAVDEFITQSIPIAATLSYTFGAESLVKVELTPDSRNRKHTVTMTFCVPSCDADIIVQDYENHVLQVADINAWHSEHSRITNSLKAIKQRGETSWVSRAYQNAWIRCEVN